MLGYYLVSLENERLEVFGKSLRLSRDRYHYVSLKKEYGSAVTTDLLLEEGNFLTDSVNYVNQELAYRNAVRTLNTVLAVKEIDKEYSYTDPIGIPLEMYDLNTLEVKMLENNIDLKAKYINQSVVKYDLQLARSEMYPKFSLGARAANTWGRVDQSNALFFDQTKQEYISLPSESHVLTTNNINYALCMSPSSIC